MKLMSAVYPAFKSRSVDEILNESEAFFMKEGKVHLTLKRLTQALQAEYIPYAIIGGMALNLLGYTRETVDVDILLTPQGLERFRERLGEQGAVKFLGSRHVVSRNIEPHQTGRTISFLRCLTCRGTLRHDILLHEWLLS